MKRYFFPLCLVTLLLLAATKTNAQWKQLEVGPPGQVWSLGKMGNYIFAGTVAGIYRSTNENRNWTNTDNEKAVYAYNSDRTVENSYLASNSNVHSIDIESSSDVDCISNVITKTSPNAYSGLGIEYSGGSKGMDINNEIRYCYWGIGDIWGSSITSDNPSYPDANNLIKNCDVGF